MTDKGWLKKQLNEAEQEMNEWPEWKKSSVNEQYEELKQYTSKSEQKSCDEKDC